MVGSEARTIVYKSPREIAKMRQAGLLVWLAHQRVASMIGPGVTTAQINAEVRRVFREYRATPLFLNYPPGSPRPFPAETCVSINEQVVHGIPSGRKLKSGDVIAVDMGCSIDGWCGDAAVTHAIGTVQPAVAELLRVTRGALDVAIQAMNECSMWSQVTKQIVDFVRPSGMGIVETLVGHGIGRQLHEPPEVPNYYDPNWEGDFAIGTGLVIAIEPMINLGGKEVKENRDGWTIVSSDRSYSAHFEHTVAMTESGAVRLTAEPSPEEWAAGQWPDWLPLREDWFTW